MEKRKIIITAVILCFVILAAIVTLIFSIYNKRKKPLDYSDLPVPKWKPNIPVDLQRIATSFAYYTNYENNFVVFKNGTCLLLDEIQTDVKEKATDMLRQEFNPLLPFSAKELIDDNWYVAFHGNIVGIVFKDEIESNLDYIEGNYLDGLIPTEKIFENEVSGQPNEFGLNGKVGLFARSRVVMDFLEPEVVRIIKKTDKKSKIE